MSTEWLTGLAVGLIHQHRQREPFCLWCHTLMRDANGLLTYTCPRCHREHDVGLINWLLPPCPCHPERKEAPS